MKPDKETIDIMNRLKAFIVDILMIVGANPTLIIPSKVSDKTKSILKMYNRED